MIQGLPSFQIYLKFVRVFTSQVEILKILEKFKIFVKPLEKLSIKTKNRGSSTV